MSEVPDLADELRVKSFDALNHLIQSVHSAKITEEQFNTGVDTLFMAVSGLVQEQTKPAFAFKGVDGVAKTIGPEPKFIDIISQCSDMIEHIYPIQKRVLFNGNTGAFKVFQWQAGDSFVSCLTCVKAEDFKVTRNRLEFPDAQHAKKAFDTLTASGALKKFGYVEVI